MEKSKWSCCLQMSKKIQTVLCILCFLFLFSCKTTFGGTSVYQEPVNYTDEDILNNEKKQINELLQSEPVEAYWRSIILGETELKNVCIETIKKGIQNSLEEKDFLTAWRYIKSLEETGEKYDSLSFAQIDSLFKKEVPGLGENKYSPKTIDECVKATVTVLVDKGLVIKYGTGMPEKILGSGFFIDKRGYIITNHHVISDMVDPSYEGYSRLYIKLPGNDDDKIPAKVIGYDPVIDLALIKAEYTPEFVFSLGSSDDLSIGDKINVIGAPLGLEGSLTSGIVSNTKRKLFTTGDVFQIDAPVNSGNSGGPCIDKNMKVQAVVFAGVLAAQNLNFAIPVEYLKQELPFLYSGGEYHHCWTGSYGITHKNGSKKTGIDVDYVIPGSSAKKSGLVPGMEITAVGKKRTASIETLQSVLRDNTPGTIVSFQVKTQDNDKENHFVYLSKRPENPALEIYRSDVLENYFLPLFGLDIVRASTSSKTYKINRVIENTAASEMQFSENDPITIKTIKTDNENKYILAQIVTRRHKTNLLDVMMVLGSPYDGPNYF